MFTETVNNEDNKTFSEKKTLPINNLSYSTNNQNNFFQNLMTPL